MIHIYPFFSCIFLPFFYVWPQTIFQIILKVEIDQPLVSCCHFAKATVVHTVYIWPTSEWITIFQVKWQVMSSETNGTFPVQ